MWGFNKSLLWLSICQPSWCKGCLCLPKQISDSTHGAETPCAKAGPRADTTGPEQQLLQIITSMESNRCSFMKNRFIPWHCLAEDHYSQIHIRPGLDFFSSCSYSKILRKKSNSLQQYGNGFPSPWITTSQGRTRLQEHHCPWEPHGFSTQAAPASSAPAFTDFISVLKIPAKV